MATYLAVLYTLGYYILLSECSHVYAISFLSIRTLLSTRWCWKALERYDELWKDDKSVVSKCSMSQEKFLHDSIVKES